MADANTDRAEVEGGYIAEHYAFCGATSGAGTTYREAFPATARDFACSKCARILTAKEPRDD